MSSPSTTSIIEESTVNAKTLFDDEMNVTKRDGNLETVSFDKILSRIKKIGMEVDIKINYTALAMKVIDQLYDGISTTKIDELTAEQCASMASTHPDYNILAGRIIVSNHQKNTESDFSKVMTALYNFRDIHGKNSPLISETLYKAVLLNSAHFDSMCIYDRDYLIDYFGFKTLERAYLMKVYGKVAERPQHMWLRVAIGIHVKSEDGEIDIATMSHIYETYEYMSMKYFTHATPTLFNAGTPRPQLSSCFLIAMESDSIDGIYNTLKDCANISKWAGGIGLHIHNVRATGSHIRGTNGKSNGIVPMLRVFNNTAKYVDQCILPTTIIYTTEGPKEIQHCSVGETKIFNLLGETEIIKNVLEHEYDGELLEIETMHSIFPLQITPEHPVYVVSDQPKGVNYTVIKNRIEKNIAKFEWKDAGELTADDMIVYPIPSYSVDNQSISEDDCYMYGIVLGDGSVENTLDTGYVSMHSENKSHIREFMIKYFEEKLVKYSVSVDGNTCRVRWNKTIHLPFRYNDCYDETKTKRVHSRWLNLPIEKSKFILKGLIDTDGCIGSKELVFDSTSLNLIESVRFLCLRMGLLTSGYVRDRVGEKHTIAKTNGTIENKKISYSLRIPRTREICDLIDTEYDETQFFKFLKHDNFMMTRIQDIKKTNYTGVLYDLQMEKQHDYLIHNGLVHNGGGKRNGSFAVYMEPWHADIEMFLQMRKNHGDEELKARDLFYALWIPDLFMERVKANGTWTLMCPDECPGLADVYGDAFVQLYESYEKDGKGRTTVPARDLWFKVLDAQMETGTPYLLFKDACNNKSNQKNIGTIKSSNLCVAPETLILTDIGHMEIGLLEDQKVNVWNGEEFSEVVVKKTGVDQELIDIYFSNNKSLTCTHYHKFYVVDSQTNQIIMKEANELTIGTKIMDLTMPECNSNESYENVCVINIIYNNRIDDTYCFTELKRGMGVFNGIITGQCSEIVQYSDDKETAVCNLASIALPTFLTKSINDNGQESLVFDYEKLHKITKVVAYNLNSVIDVNFYPTEKTKTSNMRHRPIGIGIQGLADVFMMMNIPFLSEEAKVLNKHIFETIYHAALESSCESAEKEGPYETFPGSPASQGILQFDMWNVDPGSDRYDWAMLKEDIKLHGLRNSLLLAPMPTASTSQILGFNECIEPITSNIYSRRTSAGEFILANKYLLLDLIELNLWNDKMKNNIIANHGSIQHLEMIPQHIRDKYKTVWEIPMRHLIDMAADRGAFICQSQSLNLWLEDPNYNTLTSMHFYSWSKGLKTGIYYLRRRGRHQAQQFTIEPQKAVHSSSLMEEEDEICDMCSS